MKTILTTMALALCLTLNAQNLIVTGTTSISSSCGSELEEVVYSGDLNFNNNSTLILVNVILKILGNINGEGKVENASCGTLRSEICYGGYNNAGSNVSYLDIDLVNCSTLSSPKFDINKDFNHYFQIYNLLGQKLKEGMTNLEMYTNLPKGEVLLVDIEGFKGFKTIIK